MNSGTGAHLLEARGLTRKFGGVVALDHLDLAIAPNEILGLIGPNGSGKTTFFNVATGIYGPDAGAITFDGAAIHYNWWGPPNGFGRPGSHGCLGMMYNDSKFLWDWAGVGTPIVIHY